MKQKFRIFCFSIIIFSSFSIKNSNAIETNDNLQFPSEYKKIVLIINQVRGNECCDPGSTEFLSGQITALKENNLRGNFAVRYDVLANYDYLNLLSNLDSNQFQIGAFLEITPNLTRDAGVEYHGNASNWYQAQNAYTVGYSIEDRKKIVDTYMKKFKQVFGYYPKFSTAWIMDTDTVNYLQSYGTSTHQITREQWGTDSYTLSGGPVHYPYFASKDWLFVKASEQASIDSAGNAQTLVLRQTGADPLFNYGDDTNSFTTQPNDYMLGNRGFDYFTGLKENLLDQQHNQYGFLLLGLENSMAQKFQVEFINQLNSIRDDLEVETFTVKDLEQYLSGDVQKVVGVIGNDVVNQTHVKSFWVNSSTYRIRMIYKNDSIYISDLRILNDNLEDPYNNYVAKDLAFWVTPYIFNASHHYTSAEPIKLSYLKNFKARILDELRNKFLPEFQKSNFEANPSSNDVFTNFDGIKIADEILDLKSFSRNESGDLVLSWSDVSKNNNQIIFLEQAIKTNFNIDSKNIMIKKSDFLSLAKTNKGFELRFNDIDSEKYLSMLINCENESCVLSFVAPSNDNFFKLRENLYPHFFPEIKQRALDNLKSVFYAHNQYAVVGKNPVRLVFIPRDSRGFATDYLKDPEIVVDPLIKAIAFNERQSNGTTFMDIFADYVGSHKVNFSVGDEINKNVKVFFAPNCKIDKKYCLLHPIHAIWYLKSMFYTKLRNF